MLTVSPSSCGGVEGGPVVKGIIWVVGFILDYFVIILGSWCNDIYGEDLILVMGVIRVLFY